MKKLSLLGAENSPVECKTLKTVSVRPTNQTIPSTIFLTEFPWVCMSLVENCSDCFYPFLAALSSSSRNGIPKRKSFRQVAVAPALKTSNLRPDFRHSQQTMEIWRRTLNEAMRCKANIFPANESDLRRRDVHNALYDTP